MPIELRLRRAAPTVRRARVQGAAELILAGVGHEAAQLSVVLTGDRQVRALNRRWRGKDKSTDVLSFPQGSAEASLPIPLLGDVVISLDTAQRQAKGLGHPLEDEVCRLLVHGVLHLLGHDHERSARAATRMRREERRLLGLLGEAGWVTVSRGLLG